jgi:hypothetical protein
LAIERKKNIQWRPSKNPVTSTRPRIAKGSARADRIAETPYQQNTATKAHIDRPTVVTAESRVVRAPRTPVSPHIMAAICIDKIGREKGIDERVPPADPLSPPD